MISLFENLVSLSNRIIPFRYKLVSLLWILGLLTMNLDVLVRVVETHLVDANELAASKIMDHSFTSAYSDMPDRQKRKDVAHKR